MRVIMLICPIITKKIGYTFFYSMIVIEYFKCRVLFYCGGLDENINCWGDERSKNK